MPTTTFSTEDQKTLNDLLARKIQADAAAQEAVRQKEQEAGAAVLTLFGGLDLRELNSALNELSLNADATVPTRDMARSLASSLVAFGIPLQDRLTPVVIGTPV